MSNEIAEKMAREYADKWVRDNDSDWNDHLTARTAFLAGQQSPDRETLRRLLVLANDRIDSSGAFNDELVIDEFLTRGE